MKEKNQASSSWSRYWRSFWQKRNLWLLGLLCWILAVVFLLYEEETRDFYFRLRGESQFQSSLVLVTIDESTRNELINLKQNGVRQLKEINYSSDNLFWDRHAWRKVLESLISAQPAAIGVTCFFDENLFASSLLPEERKIFHHPQIVWAAQQMDSGRLVFPLFPNSLDQAGVASVTVDKDSVVRKHFTPWGPMKHFAAKMSEVVERYGFSVGRNRAHSVEASQIINFLGSRGFFTEISFRQVMAGPLSPDLFKNKIILIGSIDDDLFLTPLGHMSRLEVLGHIVDNQVEDRWVTKASTGMGAVLLLIVLVCVIWILSRFMLPKALVFIFLSAAGWLSLAAWMFDRWSYWLPVISILVLMATTLVVFLVYFLNLKEKRNLELQNEGKALRELESLKDNFISLVSHDLKTPLAKISGLIDHFASQNRNMEEGSDLDLLKSSALELHRYIELILQAVRVESQNFRIQYEIQDINDIIRKAIRALNPLAKEHGIGLVENLEPLFSIEIDGQLIYEVVFNLIDNAIKYAPQNSLVTVSSYEKEGRVTVMVADEGGGIDPAEQMRIWDKFYRGTAHTRKGTGLGLYLVKFFIQAHGGEVFVQSNLNHGTHFGFSVPVQQDPKAISFPMASSDSPVTQIEIQRSEL